MPVEVVSFKCIILNECNLLNIYDRVGVVNFFSAYRKSLFRCGEWAEYEYEGEVNTMIINGYDKYGRLCLSDKNGREIVCDIKEIRFIL